MENIKMLFEYNRRYYPRIRMENKCVTFVNRSDEISDNTIKRIIDFINSVHKNYSGISIPIVFDFKKIKFADKLTYIIFECICYSLIKDYKHSVYISLLPEKNILTDGIFYSPLQYLTGDKYDPKKFLHKFNIEIYQKHYRTVINGDVTDNYLGVLNQNIATFLSAFGIEIECKEQITEVIGELVGNACEHGQTSCLLDIDITTDYFKSDEDIEEDALYYGINIAILNFSKTLFGDGIKCKIDKKELGTRRYIELAKAYDYHKKHFSNQYSYVDFCNIASLQDKISGRPNEGESGGTGLTVLIRSLQEKATENNCYVLSGNRSVVFDKELLHYDDNNWLGFNKTKNFFSDIPNELAFYKCEVFIPGTAYNLNLIMKRDDLNERN
ncbi:MAG: hypothetical protein IKV41_03285 [Oscillospiraceae bacterium]|nr:hypothetical protein [Oscillospiraceae bacterium]